MRHDDLAITGISLKGYVLSSSSFRITGQRTAFVISTAGRDLTPLITRMPYSDEIPPAVEMTQ